MRVISFICVIHIWLCSFAQWNLVYYHPLGFNDMEFVNIDTGYLINTEQILITKNGGISFDINEDFADIGFQVLDFPKPCIGFVVGYTLGPYVTHDCGITWDYYETLPFGIADGVSIFMLDTINGFAGGGAGEFGRTTDGFHFITYQSIDIIDDDVIALYFINPDTGFAGTEFDSYRTIDGGDTWTKEGMPTSASAIEFINDSTGFFAYYHFLYKTNNLAESFEEISPPETPMFETFSMDAVSEDTIYLAGLDTALNACIGRTFDGGDTWYYVSKKLHDDYLDPIIKINCIDGMNCYAASSTGKLLKTSNGGDGGIVTIENTLQEITFSIFPNPSTTIITISYHNKNQIKQIITTNYLGEKINITFNTSPADSGETLQADISHLPVGMYFTEIITEKGRGVQKWVKQ